jgi:hypothetical protein
VVDSSNGRPGVALIYADTISQEIFQPFARTLSESGLAFEMAARPLRPQASIRWLLPTPVALWLAKTLLDSFAKEASKEAYQALKKAIAALWGACFGGMRAIRAEQIGSKGKISAETDPYSITFSIMAEGSEGLIFKLLFRDDTSAEAFNLAVAEFFTFLARYYSGQLDQPTESQMTRARVIGRTILMAYDNAMGCFVFLDPVPNNQRIGAPGGSPLAPDKGR